ncbi:MAG TPA: PQQ-dependent dehydrogenase, methanol/ethanol family [Bryobacterales bacterium]|nr:PQQ-dependent dehydrogenase, methanol/ethanol family [Bryobacterales bacterium]
MTRILLALALASAAWAQSINADRLNHAGQDAQNWLIYSRTYNAWRYSPLDQINRSNLKRLVPVWSFQTGDIEGGLQCTPLVADGVMYISTSWNRVYALDAATGKTLWRYVYEKPKQIASSYAPWNRGVALGYGLVFLGTLDNHLVALDAKTGREAWNVNVEDVSQCGCNITGAPLVVKDKVIVGVTGGDTAHRGYINAFDARTGRHVWRFWTIPGPGEPGNDSWKGESWKLGGGSSWMTGSYDPELNLVYWGVGNPAADFYGEDRSGSNLYTDSTVALDADTGKLKWYYQQIPFDVWDWDSVYENVLFDREYKGRRRKLLLNVNKGGYVFVVDRTNGKFVNAWPLVESLNWIKGVDEQGNLIGRNEPIVGKPNLICPSVGGGRSWNHGAFNPKTGLFYTTGIEWCEIVTPFVQKGNEGKPFMAGNFEMKPALKGESGGHLGAYDPVTGKQQWLYRSKYPLLASVLATGGGLIFTGDPEGQFFALDAKTGEKVWNFQTGSGHRGSPISYAVKGRQYIATPSGWGSAVAGLMPQLWPETEAIPGGSAVFVFALTE